MIDKWPVFRKIHNRRAQGMVEFALALPIVLLLMFGIIEFGRLILTFAAVFSSSREAARIGTSVGSDRNDALGQPIPYYLDCDKMREAARRLGAFAGVGDADIDIRYDRGVYETASFNALTRRCTTSGPVNGSNPLTEDGIAMGDRVVVRVTRTYHTIVPWIAANGVIITQTTPRLIIKKVEVQRSVPILKTPTPPPTSTPTRTNTPTNTPTITGTPYTPTPTSTSTNTLVPTIKPKDCVSTPGTANYCTPVPSATITPTPTITLTPTPDCSYVILGSKYYSSQYSNVVVIDIYNTSAYLVVLEAVSIEWSPASSHLNRIDFGAPLPNTPVPTPNTTVQPTQTKVPTLAPIVNTIWASSATSPSGFLGVSGPNLYLASGGSSKPLEFSFDVNQPSVGRVAIRTLASNGQVCEVSSN